VAVGATVGVGVVAVGAAFEDLGVGVPAGAMVVATLGFAAELSPAGVSEACPGSTAATVPTALCSLASGVAAG
jgi:hypothetical protein